MTHLIEAADQMKTLVGKNMLLSFVEVAKLDHLLFKFRVYQQVSGTGHGHAHPTSDPHQCRFGHWYYGGEGQALAGKNPAYRELEAPHNEVHQSGSAALNAWNSGQKTQVLEQLQRMENSSSKLVAILDRISH
ncbi:CZB domain-containing protein [Chitinibacter sp. S2-10]|uniref:CZB domain-containing protein n=1 Tax=Chitinibacter sp. S2-10 TaxID=3373597 RepID=UPI0039779C6F